MGTLVDAKCDNCGYAKEKISFPGRDRGFVAICESMICLDEKELFNITVGYEHNSRFQKLLKQNPNIESNLGKCPSCHGTNLESWHRQCPKCGETISLSYAGSWD